MVPSLSFLRHDTTITSPSSAAFPMTKGSVPKPQYLDAFKAFLKKHPSIHGVGHSHGRGRGVQPYPEHWSTEDVLADAFPVHRSAWARLARPTSSILPNAKMATDLIIVPALPVWQRSGASGTGIW